MWDSLWYLRGATPVPTAMSDAELLDRVVRLLDRQGKLVTSRRARALAFEAPFWWARLNANGLALAIYDRGRFRIENGADGRVLRYALRSLYGFLLVLCFALVFFLLTVRSEGFGSGIITMTFVVAWL
ncbi:nitroreductase [Sphingomonas zeicaulis]|uniref:hypothetical protein n=1 Tax=Sphingomonas zeicaulis TaxID=1632740 RepID=UPI003D198B7C